MHNRVIVVWGAVFLPLILDQGMIWSHWQVIDIPDKVIRIAGLPVQVDVLKVKGVIKEKLFLVENDEN